MRGVRCRPLSGRILAATLLATGLLGSAFAGNASPHNTRLLADITELTRSHKSAQLRRLSDAVTRSGDTQLQGAYLLARYVSNPRSEASHFANEFPTNFRDFQYVYVVAPSIAGRHGTFPFEELQRIASAGNDTALRKLLLISVRADGALGEFIAGSVSVIARQQPSNVLRDVSTMKASDVDELVTNPLNWCDAVPAIESVHSENGRIRVLQHRIARSGAQTRC